MRIKKILYIDMDGVMMNFESGIKRLPPFMQENFKGRYDEAPGIFELMKPISGAIAAFNELSDLYDTYILSTSPWENVTAASEKVSVVKKYFGDSARKRLILSHHKHLNIGDYLVDDRLKNGAAEFTGEHIHYGTTEFPHWRQVLKYLKEAHANDLRT